MLTISIDRIDDLLEQASELQLELDLETDDDAMTAEEAANLAEILADEPAYPRFAGTLAALTTEEVCELLALSLLGRTDSTGDEWPAILERARGLPEETPRDELMRTLLLSDAIEAGLARLGIFSRDEPFEEPEDEDDERPAPFEGGGAKE